VNLVLTAEGVARGEHADGGLHCGGRRLRVLLDGARGALLLDPEELLGVAELASGTFGRRTTCPGIRICVHATGRCVVQAPR